MAMFNFDGNVNNDNISEEATLESQQLINEAILLEGLTEDDLYELLEESAELGDLIEGEVITEASIVKLDKAAKMSQARMMALYTIAREKGDRQFKKLLTLWRMERNIDEYLDKRYGAEATRRARQTIQKKARSTSKIMNKAAKKADAQLNGGAKAVKKATKNAASMINGKAKW